MAKVNDIVLAGGAPALVLKKGEALSKRMEIVPLSGSERVLGKLVKGKEYQTGRQPEPNRFAPYQIDGVNGFTTRVDLPIKTQGEWHYENEAEKKRAVWALLVDRI
jgi:hypothetical protein